MKTFLNNLKPKIKILKYFLSVLALIFIFIFFYNQAGQRAGKSISIALHPGGKHRGLAAYESGQKTLVPYPQFLNLQNLFNKAKIIKNESQASIQFVVGNILVSDENGNKIFACQQFSNINLLFEADGLFIEGEKVLMEVEQNCLTHSDHQFIGPFSLPVEKILHSPSGSENIFKEDKMRIEFSNVSGSWPKRWTLVFAQFKNLDQSKTLDIIKEFSKNPKEQKLFSIEFY